ncbi:AAA family ATPase [Desulfobacterales bacterium HSG2]|nr:AAA family ATPase [Desulfobacterales bacterium HSG2]
MKVFLEKIHIRNFLSLRDVTLPLKRLTVLVGPNASGKSNVLRSLWLLKRMMHTESPPSAKFIQEVMWAGQANCIGFHLQANADGSLADYRLELDAKLEDRNQIAVEELIVNKVKVISIRNGQGEVKDEDGEKPTIYRPSKPKLSLKSASDYGNKPVTGVLAEFIKDGKLYDFDPDEMRGGNAFYQDLEMASGRHDRLSNLPGLDGDGSTLRDILSYWFENDKECFDSVNKAFEDCTKCKIEKRADNRDEFCLWEGSEKPVSLRKASDGTMRLLAYQILLSYPEVPPLIAIEEPERNLHPSALKEMANLLEQLAERTQVIITTHSSRLLDAFNLRGLSDNLGILFLQNIPGKGTKVIDIEETRRNWEDMNGWITDYGIGSAIFDSGLLQELMEG